MSSTPTALVCREVFDENSQPSAEEISDYAQQIGIDPVSESHLLPLARDGLMQALPPPWKAYFDDKLKTNYYYNPETRVTQWEHPLDQVYKNLVIKAKSSDRGDSILDDTCMSIQDLITYEEDAKQISTDRCDSKDRMGPQDGDSSIESSLEDELSSGRKTKQHPDSQTISGSAGQKGFLASIGRKTLPSLLNPLDKKPNDFRGLALPKKPGDSNTFPRTAQASMGRFKLGIYQQNDLFDDSFGVDNSDSDNSDSRKNLPVAKSGNPTMVRPANLARQNSDIIDLSFKPNGSSALVKPTTFNSNKPGFKQGFTLTGGGSIFLKSNRGNVTSNDGPSSLGAESKNFHKAGNSSSADNPKSILRERNFGEPMYKPPVLDKSDRSKQNDLTVSEEDKKSVRFNLEKDVEVQYDYSPSPSSNSSSDILQGKQGSVVALDKVDRDTLDSFTSTASAVRRNSENSVLNKDVAGFVRNQKLTPLGSEEGGRFKNQPLPSIKGKVVGSPEELGNSVKERAAKIEEGSSVTNSPTRKLIKPHPGDFIKPNLFQKPFEKFSDILKPTSPDTDSESDMGAAKGSNPVLKNKISINLMDNRDPDESPTMGKNLVRSGNVSFGAGKKKELPIDGDIRRVETGTKKFLVNRISSLRECDSGDSDMERETRRHSIDVSPKRDVEASVRARMDSQLKDVKANMEREFKGEISVLKDKLQKVHASNKADLERAILEAQKNHEADVKLAIDDLKLQFVKHKERMVEEEKIKLHKSLTEAVELLNKEHASAVAKLKEEKKSHYLTISSNLDKESIKAINELRLQFADNQEVERIRLMAENKAALEKMRSEHEAVCDDLRTDYRSEVELLRSQQAAHLSALRERLRRERESPKGAPVSPPGKEDASYERLRCDKRLLEDKYRCLKEKYARLKSDVKISIERRNKRREQSLTTGSETEKSHSHRTGEKSGEVGDGANIKMDSASRGKRLLNVSCGLKNGNNNDSLSANAKQSFNDNNNAANVQINYNRDLNLSLSESSPNPNNSALNSNLLNVAGRSNVSHISPDSSRGKPPHYRDKSPMGRIVRRDRSVGNGDNDNSIGNNDISLSQSDSHTVSNGKYAKKVVLVDHKDVHHGKDEDLRGKGALRKALKPDYAETTVTDYQDSSDTGLSDHKQVKESLVGRSRKKLFTRLKSASTSRLNYSVSAKLNERACSPVENLRQQLRKLEDLEEQFPDVTLNADTTAYRLRYPFPDPGVAGKGAATGAAAAGGGGSGELGFLRHRALVEREGVRRARAALRRRADVLRQRRRSPQAWQEECELTDMEVSLHRTKSILGEKVIRLRHIEKSLRRIQSGGEAKEQGTESHSPNKREADNKADTTLSDISSHSSGFSSTEGHSDANRNTRPGQGGAGAAGQEYEPSSEIISSLQSLNTEIRDIWQVLNQQQQMNVAKVFPIGQLLYTDVGWQLPIAASNIPSLQGLPNSALCLPAPLPPPSADRVHSYRHITAQAITRPLPSNAAQANSSVGGVATSLVERTRDLRDWLKQQAAL